MFHIRSSLQCFAVLVLLLDNIDLRHLNFLKNSTPGLIFVRSLKIIENKKVTKKETFKLKGYKYFLPCIYSVFASNIEIGNYRYHMMGQKLTSATYWKV